MDQGSGLVTREQGGTMHEPKEYNKYIGHRRWIIDC
jgi:hypothetical protein